MNIIGFGLILFVGSFVVAIGISLIREFIPRKQEKPPDNE